MTALSSADFYACWMLIELKDAPTHRKREINCGKCTACTRPECGFCKNCIDMKKFGGPGIRKRACYRKRCLNRKI
jgi:hypothetical protein